MVLDFAIFARIVRSVLEDCRLRENRAVSIRCARWGPRIGANHADSVRCALRLFCETCEQSAKRARGFGVARGTRASVRGVRAGSRLIEKHTNNGRNVRKGSGLRGNRANSVRGDLKMGANHSDSARIARIVGGAFGESDCVRELRE